MEKKEIIELLVSIDKNYIEPLTVMLYSYIKNNNFKTNVYIMNKDLTKKDIDYISKKINNKLLNIISIKINDDNFKNAPVTKRFPITMYYRLLAYQYLPKNIDKVLYLDPDIIVNGELLDLYKLNITEYCYAAASHVDNILLKKFNDIRLNIKKENIYINSGVLLINLKEIRKSPMILEEIYTYVLKNKKKLFLPDQDIISKFYAGKIKEIDTSIYNITEKMLPKYSFEWIINNSKIIHYCGKNKPWKNNYKGRLNKIYKYYEEDMIQKDK